MNMNNNVSELNCYDVILKYFQNNSDSPSERELWKNKAYLKLIELWKKGKIDTQNTRNSMILLLNLFGNVPPDIFNSRGRSLNRVESENKQKLKNILKKELES
ncbi:MAG: hypothetical protein EU541_07990 [Promethearchaeota archaeon]|nr:MAG: hypothetical protein EU541_07990 [Candidatus Lokiarchaeota archaeon]